MLAKETGLDGVVCAAQEVPSLKENGGPQFITVCPGIQLDDAHTDQQRVMSPEKALKLGADYLVIGRAITKATDPMAVLSSIHKTITLCASN